MSALNTNTKILLLPFNHRVERVATEISKRLTNASPKQQSAIQARLWCQWLAREVSL